jgi:hypothetical protein
MRTYTHGVIGYLLYAKRPRHEQRLAIMGSILPDVFLALGFVAHYGAIVIQSPLVEALHTLLHHLRVAYRNGCYAFVCHCRSLPRPVRCAL